MVYSARIGSTLLRNRSSSVPLILCRHKSLTAAIERGRQGGPDRPSRPRTRSTWGDTELSRPREADSSRFRLRRASEARQGPRQRRRDTPASWTDGDVNRSERINAERRPSLDQPAQNGAVDRPEKSFYGRNAPSFDRRNRAEKSRNVLSPSSSVASAATPKSLVRGPEALPYATAASEFIYGYSSVLAAIKANRRKFYNLYIHSRGASRDGLMSRIRAQKLFSITKEVGDEYIRAMDKASSGRPHNGVILESSPLPVPPITELKSASLIDENFQVSVDKQSTEDALVNGKQKLYSYKSSGWRYPLILYVDGVLDEGNLGAIARSAYFLGVDAIITPTRQTAPWSHIALKASAGAAEAIPLFKVKEPANFLRRSTQEGWRIYASDAIPPAPSTSSATSDQQDGLLSKVVYTIAKSTKRLPAGHSPVEEHPTILMMGAEGTGLRDNLMKLAHYKVGIPHGRNLDEIGVDSLNVSVAASLLCYEMLQKPQAQTPGGLVEALF